MNIEIFKLKKMCFFHGVENSGAYVGNSEIKERGEEQKEIAEVSLEEQSKTSSKRVIECANNTYETLKKMAGTLSPEESKMLNVEIQEQIRGFFKTSSIEQLRIEIGSEEDMCERLLNKGVAELEKSKDILRVQYAMPDSFVGNGGTFEEWVTLHPEIQEYEINGGMNIPIDPMELMTGGLGRMVLTAGGKGVFLLLKKGKAFLAGVAEELVPITMKDAVDFVKFVKNKTGEWVKNAKDFTEDLIHPVGKTPDGLDMTIPNKGAKMNMTTQQKPREVQPHHVFEQKYIDDRIESLNQNLSNWRNKINEVKSIDEKETLFKLRNELFFIGAKLVDESDKIMDRFKGFQNSLKVGDYKENPEAIKNIIEKFSETGRKLEDVSFVLNSKYFKDNERLKEKFIKIKKTYRRFSPFFNSL